MTAALALAGWGLLGALALAIVRLRRRLELVARAEHELRGPVTVLSLAAEALERELADSSRAQAFAVELERLRAALADLSAARLGRAAVRAESLVPLEPLARGALEAWSPTLRAAGRETRVDWRAGASIRAAPGRLAQALANLVANAVEHGEGPVELSSRETPQGVRLELRNSAASDGRARRRGGRGLSIATSAAEAAGGRLEFESREGKAVAALDLPAADAQAG